MKYTTEEIQLIKSEYVHANDFIEAQGFCYPTVKYVNAEDSWVEFTKCFVEGRESFWGNKLRAKYADGKNYFSQHGRG